MKKFLEKLKNPPLPARIVIFIVAGVIIAGSLLLALLAPADNVFLHVLSYLVYAAAALSLVYVVYLIVSALHRLPKRQKNGKVAQFFAKYPRLKFFITTTFSLAVSIYNAAYNAYFGIQNGSYWFISLSVYYFLLILLRGAILLYQYFRKERVLKTEVTIFLVCGAVLTATAIALSGVILMMIKENAAFEKTGIMIYVAAVFAFYKIVTSIVQMVKARKEDDYTIKMLRRVNFSAAAVAIFALQSTLTTAFSSERVPWYYDAITGGVVCALILTVGSVTIVQANKKLIALRQENE